MIYSMRRESEANSPINDSQKVCGRVAVATGISKVQNIANDMKTMEDGEGGCFSTPNKKRRREKS